MLTLDQDDVPVILKLRVENGLERQLQFWKVWRD